MGGDCIMSYVARSRSLWFNLPGVVAAYQPVRAPGPVLARYNQANGGRNLYKATDGTAPTWRGATGWYFAGASSQFLNTGITAVNDQTWSMVVRFSGLVTSAAYKVICGAYNAASPYQGFMLSGYWDSNSVLYMNSADVKVSPKITDGGSGVLAVAGLQGYRNGIADGSPIGAPRAGAFYPIRIGAVGTQTGAQTGYMSGFVQSLAIYRRTLSAAEVWQVSRQMAYCDVNPDWSAWGRRRQWYYLAGTAGTRPTWLGEWWG